jgi:hypothetical protein
LVGCCGCDPAVVGVGCTTGPVVAAGGVGLRMPLGMLVGRVIGGMVTVGIWLPGVLHASIAAIITIPTPIMVSRLRDIVPFFVSSW